MELKGTLQSIRSFETALTTSFPHKLLHNGKYTPSLDSNQESKCYSKLYQLFPHGAKKLWEERVNVRFTFDERFGLGTVKISAEGLELLPLKIHQLAGIIEDTYLVPKSNLSEEEAKKLGALNTQ